MAEFIDNPQTVTMLMHWFTGLQVTIHELNAKWWHDAEGNRLERNKGELLALIHSEISECLEGVRKNSMDDHLPNRKMEEVELADAMIRIMDYAEGYQLNVIGAMIEKLKYNRTRADHSHEQRARDNGKKF